ncbi:MAG: patatin-like phospholipase family protein [Bacteroidia bacterium]|nr:patatin-like phospholipase family protein [Bacteroidia bacterium]
MKNNPGSERKWLSVLAKLFESLDENLLRQILEKGKILEFNTGETIFKQGDTEKNFFIVLSGRFRAVAETNNKMKVLGDITEGEPVGEFALFTGAARSATVYAMRPSVTLELSESEYLDLVGLQPAFAQKMTSIILNRLKSNSLQKKINDAPKNIALINLQESHEITPWTELIEKEFNKTNVAYQKLDYDAYKNEDPNSFFQKLESSDDMKFFVCSSEHSEWSKQCYAYSDLIVIAAEFNSDCEIHALEKELELYKDNLLHKKVYLLLLHPENAPNPVNTIRWLEKRNIDLHIHFRKDHANDVARFCRIITNRAIGLVLSGGGAKGYAHIGAVKALMESGIQIDFLGGTSAGALYGLTMVSQDFQFEKINFYAKDSAGKRLTSNDYTVPVISLLTGKKLKSYLQKMLGEICLEDLWISSYCITTNFSTASLSMHETGLVYQKVLASIAIPGVFPPVIIDGELHVDGGVMDNLPIQSMYKYPVSHIIALSLSSTTQRKFEIRETPSNKELFWDKLLKRKKYRMPGLSSLIINSLTLNSVQKQEQHKANVSVYLELNLKGFGFLDDSKWKQIIQSGYDQMKDYLNTLNSTEKFW